MLHNQWPWILVASPIEGHCCSCHRLQATLLLSSSGCGLTGTLFYVFLFRDPAMSHICGYDILIEGRSNRSSPRALEDPVWIQHTSPPFTHHWPNQVTWPRSWSVRRSTGNHGHMVTRWTILSVSTVHLLWQSDMFRRNQRSWWI